MNRPHNLVIFASGTGTNAARIIEYFQGREDVRISRIITNKQDAGVLGVAGKYGIPSSVIGRADLSGNQVVELLEADQVDWIILAGFLLKMPANVIEAFPGRILNIHPALLPKFGGKGMYGQHVHEAVIQAGETETGISIHYVDEHYDSGDMVFQAKVQIEPSDTAISLAQKVRQLEHDWYPRIIDRLVTESRS